MKMTVVCFAVWSLLTLISCQTEEDPIEEPEIDEVAQQFVAAHNVWRAEVGVDDLIWSEELATSAKEWADELSKDCGFNHSDGEQGENLFKGTAGFFTIKEVVDAWGNEKEDYNYEANSCEAGKVCGHYTQVVWEGTTEVGCGMTVCDGFEIWVCQYLPAGNIVGQRPY